MASVREVLEQEGSGCFCRGVAAVAVAAVAEACSESLSYEQVVSQEV